MAIMPTTESKISSSPAKVPAHHMESEKIDESKKIVSTEILNYKKRLEGIHATPELLDLVNQAIALATTATTTLSTNTLEKTKGDDTPDSTRRTSSSSVMTRDQASKILLKYDSEVLSKCNNNQKIAEELSSKAESKASASSQKSRSKTQKQDPNDAKTTTSTSPSSISIQVLLAAGMVLEKKNRASLEQAIRSSCLAFTPEPPASSAGASDSPAERLKFQKRMERLRLKQEETKYSKLTRNVMDSKVFLQDDVTTRSMTYAASIGLNMIVAPLSFGCFMYFFSGNILGWVSEDSRKHGTIDIRRVIVSVISGVIMLFIEMLLFVIRTHEVDRAMRGKQRKRDLTSKAFGHYTANTERTYNKEE